MFGISPWLNHARPPDILIDTSRGSMSAVDIVASNNSWGGGGFSQALSDAVGRSAKANILFIAAAGSGGSDGVGDNNDVAGGLRR